VIASAALPSPRPQHHSSIRWQADCGAQGRQAEHRSQRGSCFSYLSPRIPLVTSWPPPGVQLAADQEAMSAYRDS
jgi:hypothetical protein